MRKTGAWK